MLSWDVTAALPEMRRQAEAMMLDAGRALRPGGKASYDPATKTSGVAEAEQFASRCKIQTRNLAAQNSEVGERTVTTVRTELHLPADTAPLRRGDVWEITATHSSSLQTVGQRLRVVAPVAGTLKTARRYEVEEQV